MNSNGDRRSNEERGAEKHMDEYLKSIGLHRKKIAKDGSCLFRAVAEQVLHCQSLHTQVRSQCVEYLRKNRENYEAFIEGDFEEYLYKLQDPQQWVGEVEINALAMIYKRDFWIFQEPCKPAVNITAKNFKDRVQLCFLNGNHYDCVYPLSHVKNTAMCQSILYELLYDKVCGVDRSQLGLCQRMPKPSDILIDDCLPPCPSSDESDTEDTHRQENGTCASVVKSKGRGRGRFLSERVKRSLNPALLRNVQFDQWHRSKKAQQKMDFCIAAGMQYSVGDRCQVRVDACGEVVNATVKKLSPNDSGPVTVYNDQMGEIEVPLWKLRPPNEASWSTVVRDKRVTNGHGEWEDRGRGRGRGKPCSIPQGAPQPTAPPAGRISKQHSWPSQATVDEREAPSRKSESVLFGLSTEQRLARAEEERNAALVELQFPDDRSFPALGTPTGGQGEGGKKKGGEKKRSQKNTRRSPVEEVRPESPLCYGDEAPSALPSLPSSAPPSSVSPPVCVTPVPKPNALSYTGATGPVGSSPPQSGMVPSTASQFSIGTPVLPAASAAPSAVSSVLSSFPKASSPPTFIAPIAPSPAVAQSFIARTTPSPPVITHNPPVVTEAPVQTTNTSHLSTSAAAAPRTEVPELHISVSDLLRQNQGPNKVQDQVLSPVPPAQSPAPPPAPPQILPAPAQIQPLPQSDPAHFPEPPPPSQVPFPSPAFQTSTPSHPPSLPQNEPSAPATLPNQDPTPPAAPQPQMKQPDSDSHPSQDPPSLPSPDQGQPPPPQPAQLHYPLLHQQLSLFYQDPLYPGFPMGDKGQVVPTPPLSTSQSGDDLPRDTNILRFFFNLGVKAYSYPVHAPIMYLLPLQQAHSVQPRPPSRSPSPLYHHAPPAPAVPSQNTYPPFSPPQSSPPSHPAPLGLPTDYSPSQPTPEPSLYHQAHHQQVPPNSFNPAHSTPQAPPVAYNPTHSTQAPPTGFNPAHANPDPPPPSYTRSAPQVPPAAFEPNPRPPPSAYSPSHPPADPSHPPDAPYPQSYPQHVQWQANQAYPMGYPYGQGYYHHQGPVEQQQPANGDTALGLRAARLPEALEGSASASAGNVNGGQMPMLPGVAGFGHSNQDVGENLMLLVDPPLDKPIMINVPKSGSGPGSPALYSPAHSHSSDSSNMAPLYMTHPKSSNQGAASSYRSANPSVPFVPGGHGAAFLQVPELMSVSVGTEEDWAEPEEARVPYRGQRRGGGYRGRGRGPYRGRGYTNHHYYNNRGRGRY